MNSSTSLTLTLLALALGLVVPEASRADSFRMPRVSVPGPTSPQLASASTIRFNDRGSRRNSDHRNGVRIDADTSGFTGDYVPYFEEDCVVMIASVNSGGSIRGNINLSVEMGDLTVNCR